MLAAFAPAAATAVALPKVIGAAAAIATPPVPAIQPPTTESPELLALGAEVEAALSAYRATAAQLDEARATAAGLWPSVPDALIVDRAQADRDFWADCFGPEVDFDGNEVMPEPYAVDGKQFQMPPRNVLQAAALKEFLADIQADPDIFDDDTVTDVASRIRPAEDYEAARVHAIEVSDIENVKRHARRQACDLYDLLFKIRNHVPRTVAGVQIVARAVVAFGEAQENSYWPSREGIDVGANVLGTTLADAVLRVAGVRA